MGFYSPTPPNPLAPPGEGEPELADLAACSKWVRASTAARWADLSDSRRRHSREGGNPVCCWLIHARFL